LGGALIEFVASVVEGVLKRVGALVPAIRPLSVDIREIRDTSSRNEEGEAEARSEGNQKGPSPAPYSSGTRIMD
jgi:hypothetical protein